MLCVWKVRLTEQVLEAHTSVIDDQSRQSSLSSFSLTQRNPVSIFSGTLLNTSLFTYHSTISFSTVLCATGTQAKLTTLASRLILDHDAGISTHSRSPVPTHSRSAIFNSRQGLVRIQRVVLIQLNAAPRAIALISPSISPPPSSVCPSSDLDRH